MLTSRVSRLSVSLTLNIVEKVRELRRRGVDVLDLSVGEPEHNSPQFVKDAGCKAIESDFTRYTAAAGIMELREAIVEKLARDNHLTYTPKQIVVGNGAKHAIANAMLALVEPGDEVIIPEPCWLSYPELVWLAGGEVIFAPTKVEDGFHIRAETLERLLTPRTKLVLLNSPCNPTGAVLSRADMESLAEVLRTHRAWILSDEIYEYLRFDGREHMSPAQMPGLYERTVVINGVSKSYSMTGWRIGYGAGPEPLAEAMLKIQSQMTSSACSVSQKAALAGIRAGLAFPISMREDFEKRRALVYDELAKCSALRCPKPEGAFYAFPQIPSMMGASAKGKAIKDSADFTDYLLEEYHVALVPGSAFRAPDCIRISFANSDEIVKEAAKRVVQAVGDLK